MVGITYTAHCGRYAGLHRKYPVHVHQFFVCQRTVTAYLVYITKRLVNRMICSLSVVKIYWCNNEKSHVSRRRRGLTGEMNEVFV